jgi:thioesterase domain-containing protein
MMQRAMGTQTPDWIKTFPHTEYSDLPRLRAIVRLFSRKRQRSEPAPALADDPGYARSRRTFDLECRYMWAISRYPMRRYRGRAAMFWADDEHGKSIEALTKDWRKFVNDIDVFTTPGTHFSSITTNVEALAERIQAWLASMEANPGN